MLRCKFGLLLLTSLLLRGSSSYRFLVVFPTPSFSHQRVQVAVSNALAAHGHDVVVISPHSPDSQVPKNPAIRQISISYLHEDGTKKLLQPPLTSPSISVRQLFRVWGDRALQMMIDLFSNKEVQRLLDDGSQKFDAVIVEYVGWIATHALAERFDSVLIGISTVPMMPWAHQAMGNPTHALLHPLVIFNHREKPTLLEKIQLVFDYFDHQRMMFEVFNKMQPVLDRFFPGLQKTVQQLVQRVNLAIECVSPAQGLSRPLLPNTKQIGFLHVEPPRALPEDLQRFLDSSLNGVIFVSFGSNLKSVNMRRSFLETLKLAFRELPFDVLWKYENHSMPNQPSNVQITDWAPQPDLLAHPNVKLFVTQGGVQSVEESVARGVPMVVIPLLGDQEFNAAHVEELGMGLKILKRDLTPQKLISSVFEVILNSKYKNRVLEVGRSIRDTPMNATETAVWYIEHAIRNRGTEVFKYKGNSLPYYQYYFLDVAVLIVAVKMFMVFLLWRLMLLLRVRVVKTKVS